MKKGEEFKGEFGDTVLVLHCSDILDIVHFIDEFLFIDELPVAVFLDKYKPTGRVNKALKKLFDEKNFERRCDEPTNKNITPLA